MNTIEVVRYGVKTNAVEKDAYIVADWFACKKFKEVAEKYGKKFEGFDNRIFAIIGETEKAYNVVLGSAFNHIATWCPKSLVKVDDTPAEDDITLVCDFNTAIEVSKNMKGFYN